MFQKFLASVGIGNAKVDTVLEKDEYIVGEEIYGKVHITEVPLANKLKAFT